MRLTVLLIMILSLMLFIGGCNKDDEVIELEKEIQESEAADLMAETDTTVETVSDEMAMTPEAAPVEETPEREMPMRPDVAGYTVQVGAGTDYERTMDLVELYIERGYQPFVADAIIDGETYYRVRIGAFEDIADARRLGKELNDKYSANYWIDMN